MSAEQERLPAEGDGGRYPVRDGGQPRSSVLIGERGSGLHLRDIGGRMEVIGLEIGQAQGLGQQRADGRLAAAGPFELHRCQYRPVDPLPT